MAPTTHTARVRAGLGLLFWLLCLTALARGADAPRHDLPGLIARAVASHPAVLAKRAEGEAARTEVAIARRQYAPAPTAQLAQDGGDSLATFRLTQPLWAAGRLDAGLEAAGAREAAARDAIDEARQQTALRVAAIWQGWLQARGRLDTTRRGLELLDRYAQSLRRRMEGGFAAEADLALLQARISQTHGDLGAAEAQERTARAQLAQAAGLALGPQALAWPPAEIDAAPARALAELGQAAQAHAPELKRLARELDAARADARQKRAARWPALNLVGEHSRGRERGLKVDDGRLMLALEYAPGAGLATALGADAASQRAAAIEANIEARRRELIDIVTAAHEELAALNERQAAGRRARAASRAVLASFDRQFAAGRKTWLDLLNAARELIQAETLEADLAAALQGAHWKLRLLTAPPPATP